MNEHLVVETRGLVKTFRLGNDAIRAVDGVDVAIRKTGVIMPSAKGHGHSSTLLLGEDVDVRAIFDDGVLKGRKKTFTDTEDTDGEGHRHQDPQHGEHGAAGPPHKISACQSPHSH